MSRLACTSGVIAVVVFGACSSRNNAPSVNGGTKAGASGGAGAVGAGTGGSPTGPGAASSNTACETATDCGYGEIDHEITRQADCICLFGCPYLPLNKTTIERRIKSHQAICDPTLDGAGRPCPVDDCVPLPPAICDDHSCRAERSGSASD